MTDTVTASEVEAKWADLVKTNDSLPHSLRPHQRDSLMYSLNGYHVALCVGTSRRQTDTDRHRQTQTDTDRQTDRDTDRHRQTQTDTDRQTEIVL